MSLLSIRGLWEYNRNLDGVFHQETGSEFIAFHSRFGLHDLITLFKLLGRYSTRERSFSPRNVEC